MLKKLLFYVRSLLRNKSDIVILDHIHRQSLLYYTDKIPYCDYKFEHSVDLVDPTEYQSTDNKNSLCMSFSMTERKKFFAAFHQHVATIFAAFKQHKATIFAAFKLHKATIFAAFKLHVATQTCILKEHQAKKLLYIAS